MLKKFHQFISEQVSTQALSPAQESFLNNCTEGSWSINPQTGLVDVNGTFRCAEMDISDFMGIRFGHVSGDFDCFANNLITLEGSPRTVRGNFSCWENKLTSLKGAPDSVDEDFNCKNNKLTTLDGSPRTVGRFFYCDDNSLTSLKGAPRSVGGFFQCKNNKLTSLEGCPEVIHDLICSHNQLESLKGIPELTVLSYLECKGNRLTSIGTSIKVDFKLDMSYNQLTTLKGIEVEKSDHVNMDLSNNPFPENVLKASMKSDKAYLFSIRKAIQSKKIDPSQLDLGWIDV
jgi:hypothetical protein